jgi:hypothetical protein
MTINLKLAESTRESSCSAKPSAGFTHTIAKQ